MTSMLKQIRKSKLTKMILGSIIAMSFCGTAFAKYPAGSSEPSGTTNTREYVIHVEYQREQLANGLINPEIHHDAGIHETNNQCKEYFHDANLTVGDVNNLIDDLVSNDSLLAQNIKESNITSGKVEGNNLILNKDGQGNPVTIDVSSLKTDTYVTSGSYNGDNQTITLKRNEGQEDINIKLDNIAKATDLNDLEGRVTTNETNITNLQGDVSDLDNRVTTNETNITNLQGEVVESGHMDGNTLVLVKNNQQTVEVDGIATTNDIDEVQQQVDENRENIQKETSERKQEDARLDNRINGVEQEISDINGRLDRLDGKIEKGVALAIAHASLKPLDYDPECKWSGAMGVGSYKGKNALAAGVFYHESKDVMFNLSISTCQGDTGVGAGVAFKFK